MAESVATKAAGAIPRILSQHAEEAAFLWLLRDAATRQPHYRLADLAKHDNRPPTLGEIGRLCYLSSLTTEPNTNNRRAVRGG